MSTEADNAAPAAGTAGLRSGVGGDEDRLLAIPAKHLTTLRNLRRILSYSTRLDQWVLAGSLLSAVAAGLAMPLMNILFGRLVGVFTGFFKQGMAETQDEFIQAVDQCVLYIIYLFAAKLVFSYFSNLGFRMTSMRISATIRLVYLRSLFSLPISTLDMIPPGQTAAIITVTASTLQLGISEKISNLFSSLTAVAAALAIAFAYNWLLTLATSTGLMFIALVYALTSPPIAKVMTELQEAEIQAASVATEAFTSARMVAACGAESKMFDRYASLVDKSRLGGARMARFVAAQQGLIFFGIYATFALAFWWAFEMYIMVAITSSESLIVVLLCVMLMASSIGQITGPLSAASQAADACAIFHTIIDAPKPTYGTAKGEGVSAGGDIVFENVNFTYATRPDVKILDNLNLRIPAGKVTAIVGPSGSGKSTIVGILQRWYEFNGDMTTNQLVLWLRNGLVSVSGRKLTEIDVKWWRNQIGLVQQDNALFNTTIYKNIEFGLIGTEWEHEHDEVKEKLIKKACKDAFADEFIDRLPQGYQTAVGERAMKLSGGQRQRLAIARAIVKQPKILILDEATSAIDVRSEQIVQAALDRACQGRTTVVIAHRLGTIRKADNIVVLRKGQVIQQGTHDALLADVDGPYYSLATAQKLQMEAEDSAKTDDDAKTVGSVKTEDELDWDEQTVGGTSISEKEGCVKYYSHSKERHGSLSSGSMGHRDGAGDRESMDSALIRVVEKPKARFGSFAELLSEQTSRWKLYVLILLAALGAGVSTPLQAYLFAELVSLFSYWGAFLIESVDFWCLMFFYLAVLVGCSYWALAWSTTTLGFGVTRTYRKEYFGNMIGKSASFFDHPDHSAGTLTGRLATDPTQLQQLLGTNMAFVLMSFFNLVGCIIISFTFGWKLTLVALGSSMPIVILAMFYRVRYEMKFESMSNAVFAESAKFASESIATIRTVSSLTMEDGISSRYENLLSDHISNAFQKARYSVLLFSFCDSVSLLSMAFVLWYGGHLLATHEYTPFQYMVVYIAVVQGGLSAGQWLSYGPNIANASAAADRILKMREGDDHDFHLTATNTNNSTQSERGVELEFNDVWFEYPTRAVPVLRGLNLKIEKGQFAAIVGPSGSGKTTVISLLERFYSLNRGEILHNGIDISNLDMAQYRSGISLVAQEPGLFSGSVRDNILLGVPNDATVAAADLHRAARDAGIHDFVASLPEGYDTPLGPNGVALSGGQKQRISIARALVRNPSLLLLDEATSSLDSETEREVQAVFDAAKGTRTMVVVAHRLATVQNADVIFVMGDGRLVEKGDHASLIAQRGVYFQMCMILDMRLIHLALCAVAALAVNADQGPFLNQVGNSTWVFGNDLWNVTQGPVYATKVYYRGLELVGTAVGHYMGYDGENDFEWTSAAIVARGDDFIDISFSTNTGDLHWVVFDGLAGSYQYFVNRNLPDLEIVRTLWRLDPLLFLNGRTYLKDQPLPDFALYANATKVQDETWELANGTFITKYDFSDFVRDRDFYGVYGPEVGSWYIHPGKDYYNSNQLSQTLTVHRESATGDSVQLNVVQDTSHFRVGANSTLPVGKIWGPWLWYLNDGSVEDAASQRSVELLKWPYPWLNDSAYHDRGELTGTIHLSDGRPAAGAAVYLGDTDTTIRPLVQGDNYYYTTYADANGSFSFENVRSGDYGLYAWSNGGSIADVYTNFTSSSVTVSKGEETRPSSLTWDLPKTTQRIFQLGDFDKKALGFKNGGPPYQHGMGDQSPANLTYTIGVSEVSDWYYAQSLLGTWTIEFNLTDSDETSHANNTALLSVSLAGYSQSAALNIDVNGQLLGSLSKSNLASDPALYRSGKTSGEWRFLQYQVGAGVLKEGVNTVGFTVTAYTQWRGFMWDSIILEWL